jgi:radical SAM superfamily enzyme YgiQ (UPF0313 family)
MMKVKMILPALTEAKSPFFRPIKYSLFPPLGLATLAAYLDPEDEVVIQDEHVETLDLNDEPDLVVIQVYITSAYRAYQIADHYKAKGAYVALGGLHVTSLPDEAAAHADSIFLGPGEDIWVQFLQDYRAGTPGKVYQSTVRTLVGMPKIRRDLIKRHLCVTSVIRKPFLRAGAVFIRKPLMTRWQKSNACRDAIYISSMIIFSAMRGSRPNCSRG